MAAALAEVASREAVATLLDNSEAALTEAALRRIAERFGEDGEIREKLLGRPHLPPSLRCDLVAAAADALSPLAAAFGLGERRVEKIMREAREEGAAAVASAVEGRDLAGLVRHLRQTGGLTVGLLMRAIVTGDRALFEAAAAELSGLPTARVAALARAPAGAGFVALYRRTGLPMGCVAPFRAALAALAGRPSEPSNRVLRPVAQRAIAVCENIRERDAERLLPLLRRLETEAALEEARAFAAEVALDGEADEAEFEQLDISAPAAPYVLRRPPPLISVNAFGDVEFLPPPIEALPLTVAEAA
jgi:uncharacterized protein (DUF2336 family)